MTVKSAQSIFWAKPAGDPQSRLRQLGIFFHNCGGRLVVPAGVDLSRKNLYSLPDLSSVHVEGDFDCSGNFLASLHGAPASIGGNFHCDDNALTSLQGGPVIVGGTYSCTSNPLKSLSGYPRDCAVLITDFGRFFQD